MRKLSFASIVYVSLWIFVLACPFVLYGKGAGHAGIYKCTSCARNAQGRIQRSAAVRKAFRVQTGHPKGWKGHVIDHKQALCNGGTDSVENMQWQTTAEAKAKDKWECRK